MNMPAQRKPNGQLWPGFTVNPSGRPKVVGEIKELVSMPRLPSRAFAS